MRKVRRSIFVISFALIMRNLVCGPRPEEGLFPHLYGGKLGKDEVERVITLNKGSGWDGVMEKAEDWLVY
jgi:uncharacterized protein (DUF952 family)